MNQKMPFVCDYCNKDYKSKAWLVNHQENLCPLIWKKEIIEKDKELERKDKELIEKDRIIYTLTQKIGELETTNQCLYNKCFGNNM